MNVYHAWCDLKDNANGKNPMSRRGYASAHE
jgi:hypothetical protein